MSPLFQAYRDTFSMGNEGLNELRAERAKIYEFYMCPIDKTNRVHIKVYLYWPPTSGQWESRESLKQNSHFPGPSSTYWWRMATSTFLRLSFKSQGHGHLFWWVLFARSAGISLQWATACRINCARSARKFPSSTVAAESNRQNNISLYKTVSKLATGFRPMGEWVGEWKWVECNHCW